MACGAAAPAAGPGPGAEPELSVTAPVVCWSLKSGFRTSISPFCRQPHAHTHSWAFPHVGANGVSLPPGKMDEKLKSENMQKRAVFKCLCYILRTIGAGRCREWRYADHIFISDILQSAPFRSQIFKIFFASGGKGALTPLTKILRTFLRTDRRVPELIPVLGSRPAGDVSHKSGGRLPLLSARSAVTLATLKSAATNFAAW